MKIRTQLLLSSAVALVIAAAAAFTFWMAALNANAAGAEQQRAQAAAREIASLLVLTQEYALHAEVRAAQQWQQRFSTLFALMLADDTPSPHAPTVKDLRAASEQLPQIFTRLKALSDEPVSALAQRRKQFLVDQLQADTQVLADGVYRWSREAAAAQHQAEARFERVGAAALGLVVLLLLGQTLLVLRRVLRPLVLLEQATLAVERGDLSSRLASTRHDELGELARRFDSMTAALADRSAELDREVALRRHSEKRIRMIADRMPVLIGYADRDQVYRFANAHYQTILGLDPAACIGRSMRDCLGEEIYRALQKKIAIVLSGQQVRFERRMQRDGKERHLLLDYVPELAADGSVDGFYILVMDITERKQAEEKLAANERMLRDITNNIPALIGYFDASERCRFANEPALHRHLNDHGSGPIESLRMALGETNYELHRPEVDQVLAGRRASFEGCVTRDGCAAHFQAHMVPDLAGDGAVRGFYLMSFDVTALKEVEHRLNELARIDPLTSLSNRRQFDEKLQQALSRSRRETRPMALLFLDVDKFKQINDRHGHGVGDAVLREFAARLQHCVRITDTVARLAGDEFVIILEGLHASVEAELVARKIGAILKQPFTLDQLELQVTSSIGVAFFNGENVTAADVVSKADRALYRAKRAGRDTFAMSRWAADVV
jgi:diguanylate cyclase (GGDEF)-like protein/PAS domain S-box-containing protein